MTYSEFLELRVSISRESMVLGTAELMVVASVAWKNGTQNRMALTIASDIRDRCEW